MAGIKCCPRLEKEIKYELQGEQQQQQQQQQQHVSVTSAIEAADPQLMIIRYVSTEWIRIYTVVVTYKFVAVK